MKNENLTVSEASKIYLLPCLFTTSNLFFGFLAIIRCMQARYGQYPDNLTTDYYTQAVWFILLAGVCDSLDGRIARLGGRESLFGKEFDSIADVVSFGVAPALMVFLMILSPTEQFPFFRQVGWIIGFLYLLCAGVRLARFNVITSWSLVLPPLMILISWLMVSNIYYPSFKKVDWTTQAKWGTFIISVTAISLIVLLRNISFAFLFLGYVFFGLFRHISRKRRALKLRRSRR